ncbi:CBS domain-containing protein [Candidatus Woesearchaeota archaeon]|nr:CBS domain-containing protein [Candidatus Woesearchaeota archaeon]
MKIKEIMTPVSMLPVEYTVADAAKTMDKKNVGSMPIEEGGKVIGLISERDILKRVVAQGKDPKDTPIREVMSSPLITISPDKSIEEANELMIEKKIRRLPVEENGKLIGMVTIRDISNNLRYSLGKRLVEGNNYSRPGY